MFESMRRGNVESGGHLVESWVRRCATPVGYLFGLSCLGMTPSLFENWFRYRLRFCKMLNFRWFFSFGLPIGCQKVLMHPNLHGKKYWLVLKKGPFKKKWFRHRSQICVYSGLVIGWWSSKLGAAQFKFEPPPPLLRRYFGAFQKPGVFDVKILGFLKKTKISRV